MIKRMYLTCLALCACSVVSAATLDETKGQSRTLIKAGDYQAAKAATAQMVSQFAGDPQLPAALNFVANEYRWVRDYNDAIATYQQVIGQYASTPAVVRARLGIAEVEVITLLEAGTFAQAKDKYDKLAADFAASADLPESIYWLALEFERFGRYATAGAIHQQIVAKYPAFQYAAKSRFYQRKMAVLALVEDGKDDEVPAAVEQLIADFRTHPELPHAVFMVGEKYFVDARNENYEQKAIKYIEMVMDDLPRSDLTPGIYPEVYYCAGRCYQELGEYLKAAEAFGDCNEANPEFVYRDYCLFTQADCYQKAKARQVDIAITDYQIKEIYREVVRKYPKSEYAFRAALRMDELQDGTE